MAGPLPDQHAAILAQKVADGQLALFVGAGLSRQAIAKDGSARQLPLWEELAEQVAKACHENLDEYGGNKLDLFDAIELGQSRFTLEEAVRLALDDKGFDPSPAHQALAELPGVVVYTTNYDGLLGKVLNADLVFEEDQYDLLELPEDKRPRLFQVHGTLAKPHTLTRQDYRLWPEKHQRAYLDLEQIISSKTVLFVGYSLSDSRLADGILPTVKKITANREKRLYAWMWKTPPHQVQLLDRRDKIEAISIERDEDWAAAFRQVEDAVWAPVLQELRRDAAFRQVEDALPKVRQPLVVEPVLGKPNTLPPKERKSSGSVAAGASTPSPPRPAPHPPADAGLIPVQPSSWDLDFLLKDLEVFRDVEAPWCPEMVALPVGEFLMGSPESDKEGSDAERPQHLVTIGYRFALGRFPVTFAEYDHFCAATQRQKPVDLAPGCRRPPVENVSWRDAQVYVEWLAKETGKPYRLPSEAEWEYACRAGTTTRYAFGDAITPQQANYFTPQGANFLVKLVTMLTQVVPSDVGAYPANPWGLYDMHGNVNEWVEDVWHDSYKGAPTDGSAWTNGQGKKSFRVGRGGSHISSSGSLRSAFRTWFEPDNPVNNPGFRVARTLD